jgi:hypothetical protein
MYILYKDLYNIWVNVESWRELNSPSFTVCLKITIQGLIWDLSKYGELKGIQLALLHGVFEDKCKNHLWFEFITGSWTLVSLYSYSFQGSHLLDNWDGCVTYMTLRDSLTYYQLLRWSTQGSGHWNISLGHLFGHSLQGLKC